MANKVDDFLAKLAEAAPKAKETFETKNRSLEKVYLNYPGNYGRYQVFPMNDVLNDFPFVTLFNTREINIPRKTQNTDGSEVAYNAWIKILPKNAYLMRDMTGRIVSSLTAQDEEILQQAYSVFDMLYNELDVRNNRNEVTSNLLRKRNYTIFNAMCLNKWDPNESRNPSRQNFCALFVVTAKGFTSSIEDNIQETTLMRGGDNSWVTEVYNRNLTDRTGFLMFSVNSKKDGSAGFAITTSHGVGNESLRSNIIPEEDAELMQSPVAEFLGWQANKDEQNPISQKRLFNAALMKEAIAYMSQQLAAIRMAKSSGIDIKEAVERTNNEVLAHFVITPKTSTPQSNDPILNSMSNVGTSETVNTQKIVENNTNPFQSAPVYLSDPVTGAPVNNGENNTFGQSAGQTQNSQSGAPFSPSFGGFGNFGQTQENEKSDLPF